MNAEQLKLLAPPLRELLERRQAHISHGQALDLVAALVGLRNWPEVLAFPKKAAAHEIDLVAIERLIDRAYARFPDRMAAYPHRLKADDVMGRLAPWRLLAPRDPSLRERLIIVSGDSALGCVRWAGIADAVLMADRDFTWGPVPADIDDPIRLHQARMAAWDADRETSDQPENWEREPDPDGELRDWSEHLSMLSEYERIELWMDPGANGQLQLLQLLDWFARQPQLRGRLFLTHPTKRLGDCTSYAVRLAEPRFDAARQREFELATRAWSAYRQSSPQAVAALLKTDLGALPGLRRALLDLLEELPAVGSGLRWSERLLLELAKPGPLQPTVLIAYARRRDRRQTFGYFEIGRLLDGLARGPTPALQGLDEGPFDLALHDDSERFKRYMNCRITLTAFGEALLDGKADWTAHTRPRYWWGGTQQTPENLWRWDAATEQLIAP